jgi:hypothetical protein
VDTTAPAGLKATGQHLWDEVTTEYDLAHHELLLLGQAAHVADLCDELQAVVDKDGLMIVRDGETIRPNPALVELRSQRLLLGRLIVALRIPYEPTDDEDDAPPRTQRRGTRGFYGTRGPS